MKQTLYVYRVNGVRIVIDQNSDPRNVQLFNEVLDKLNKK